MAGLEIDASQKDDPQAILARWHEQLELLIRQVKVWVELAGWRTRIIQKPVTDRKLGRYTVPVLLMEKDTIEVALNPVSPRVPGAEGAVDLYWVPLYHDIASLLLEDGQWILYHSVEDDSEQECHTESKPMTEEALIHVLNAFLSHAA